MRPPLHTLHPPTDYVGTLTDAAAQRLGVTSVQLAYTIEAAVTRTLRVAA